MAFDVDAALKDGHSEEEIAEYLGKQNKFNTAVALKDGYTPREIIDHLNKPKETGFVGQIGRGIAAYPSQTQETIGGGQALLGEALRRTAGEGPVSSYLLKHGLANVQEAEEKQKTEAEPSDSFTDAWHKGLGTVLGKYLPYQIGQGLANAAETLAVTGVGTLAGAATPIPGGAEAGAIGSFVGKRFIQAGIKEAAKKVFDETLEREGKAAAKEAAAKFVAEQGAKTLTEEESKALARQGAKSVASNAALATQAIGHGVGEVGSRAVENAKTPEEINMAKALPAAAVHAAADFIAEKIGLAGIHGLSKSTENWLLDVGKNWLLTGTKELPPELLQTAMERFGANLPLADKNAVKDYINTVAGSYGMTVGPGVVGGTRTRLGANQAQAEEEIPPQEEKLVPPITPAPAAGTPAPTPTPITKAAPLPVDAQAEVEKEMTEHGHTRENAEMIVRQRLREEQEATNAGQTIPPTGGVSTGALSEPIANVPAGGIGAPAGNGVVSTQPNVGLPNAGEEAKPTAVTPTPEEQLKAEDEKIKAEDERNAAYETKKSEVEQIARVNASAAFDQVGDYSNIQDAIDSLRNNMQHSLVEKGFENDPDYSNLLTAASRAFENEVEKLKGQPKTPEETQKALTTGEPSVTEAPETEQAKEEKQATTAEPDIADETDAEANAAAATENEGTPDATPVKRGRGRPKKEIPTVKQEKPKGKRGRPVKSEEQSNVDTAVADLDKALKPFDDSKYETDEEATAAEREHRVNRIQAIKKVMRLESDPKAKAALENPAITAREKADIRQGIKIEDERASRSDIHYTDKSSDKVNNNFRRAKTGAQAIKEIIKTGNSIQRFFARRIQRYLNGVKFVVIEKGDVLPAQLTSAKNAPHWARAKGLFIENIVKGTRTVYVRGSSFGEDQGVNNTTVLHELLHAALNRKLDMALDAIHGNHSLNSPLVKAYVDLVKVMDNAGRHFNDLARQGKLPAKIAALARHGGIFSDPKEFVAYGLTDEDMQEFLHGAMGFEEETSFFTDFVNAVRRFFGMDEDTVNALSDLIVISDKLLTAKKTPQMRAQAKQQVADIVAKKKANMTVSDEKASAAAKTKAAKVSATEKKIAVSDRAQDIVENMGVLGMLRDPQLFFDTFGRNGSAWTALNTTRLKAILPALQTSVVVEWAHNLGINHMKQTERLMQDMSSMRAKSMVVASEIVTDWAKLSGGLLGKLRGKKNELRDISNVMHAATDKGVDPDTNTSDKELNARWNKLSEPAKVIYRKVRNFYESNYNLYRALLDTRIGNLNIDDKDRDKIMAEIKKMYELGKRIVPYFPLMRYGQYWVGIGQHKGRQFHMFESEIDRENFIKAEVRRLNKAGDTRTLEEMLTDGQITSGNDLKGLREKSVTAESSALLKKIFTLVDDSKGDLGNAIQAEALKDQIYQLYLTTMPEQNFRKQFVHRKGTAGFSGDALRNFINSSLNMANQMSRLKYAPQLLGEIDMAKESLKGNPEAAKLGMFIDELGERVKMEVNPKIESPFMNNVANVANKYAFLYYMTSVKTALVQLASLPVFGAPVLFARHNPGDVVKEMTKSLNIFNELGVLKDGKFTMPTMTTSKRVKANPEEQLAIEAMVERGISEVTMTYDLMDRKATPSENYTGAWNKTTRAMGALFHHAERLNREVMFLTSFRLSRKAGVPIDEAIEQAVSDTYTALGNFTAQERPRIMRSPVGRTLLQFKMFPAFVTTYYARNFYRMFANEDPKVKKEAATMFFGSLAMSGLLAGYVGIPGIDMAMGVLQGVINAMRSDDDDDELEKRDLALWFRTVFMHNFFGDVKIGGKNLGDIVDEGLLNYMTGTDIAGSMSMNNIWFQDVKEQKLMQSTMQDYALGMMGPTAGFLFKQFPAAIDNWNQGKYMQGFEKILPSLFRNPVTAYRYSQEGAKSASGLPIKEPEEFTKGQLLAQALGFRTTGLAQAQEANFKAEALRQQVLQKRADVIARTDLEATRGDDDALDKAIDEIVKFNSKNPTEAITAKQLSKSLLDRVKARVASDRGFRVDKKLYPYLQDLLEPSRQQLEREAAKP
jgi:hypothetical protein